MLDKNHLTSVSTISLSLVLYLGPAALLAQQVCVEVRHLPHSLVGEAPHQLPVAHVVELLPCLLGLAAILKECHRLVAQHIK